MIPAIPTGRLSVGKALMASIPAHSVAQIAPECVHIISYRGDDSHSSYNYSFIHVLSFIIIDLSQKSRGPGEQFLRSVHQVFDDLPGGLFLLDHSGNLTGEEASSSKVSVKDCLAHRSGAELQNLFLRHRRVIFHLEEFLRERGLEATDSVSE